MSWARLLLLALGGSLFAWVLVHEGAANIVAALTAAGWGLSLVAAFHLLPLALDAAAIRVLFRPDEAAAGLRDALLTRWIGEAANSLLPAGQLGGPVLMARQLAARGAGTAGAAAIITVSTTLQTFAQVAFALVGIALVGTGGGHLGAHAVRTSSLLASAVLSLQVVGFYYLQRRGLFSKLIGAAGWLIGRRGSAWSGTAGLIDAEVEALYRRTEPVVASFALSAAGWVVGTGEVWLILVLLHHPVSLLDALLLESLGQAIRGAAFAVPAALGVQEGGYVLLAPLVGLPPEIGFALSLAKRAREILLGVPGLIYLYVVQRPSRSLS